MGSVCWEYQNIFGGAKKWSERNISPKACRNCNNMFQPSAGGSKWCDDCRVIVKREQHARSQREWRAKDPDKHAKKKMAHDLKKFGLTPDEYSLMLDMQGGKCLICGTDNPMGRGIHRKFVVDHCHTSGKVRGLLCSPCNTGIGLFKERTEIFLSAIKYLEKYNEDK